MPWSMEQKILCVKTYYETKSFQIVQARFRRKFSFNKFPNRSQIFKLVKKFETHGTCVDRRVTGSSPSGPPITIRTPDNVTRVQESVGRSPSKSLWRRSQGACTLRTLLDILFLIWGQTVADYKMLSFHLSINVIIIVVSFKILDLCPIALFQQLWNTLYFFLVHLQCSLKFSCKIILWFLR